MDLRSKIGIIILNWNGIQNTIACLKSLYDIENKNFCVVLVDNGSNDRSVMKLAEWATINSIHYSLIENHRLFKDNCQQPGFRERQLTIISLENNTGYGAGNNIGIQYLLKSEVNFILILNNDMKILPYTLRHMETALNLNQSAGAVGCDLIDMDTGKQLPTGNMNYWLGVHFLIKFRNGIRGIRETNFIPGCAMLVRKSVFEAVGGFNEKYFLYADDIEFCNRVTKNGWKLITNLDAKAFAKVSASSGGRRNPLYYYFIVRNTLYFICNELDNAQRIVAMIAFLSARVAQLLQWAIQRKHTIIIAALTGAVDFLKGISGMGSAKRYLDELELDIKLKQPF